MGKEYRYILFDLDRTLWDFKSNSRRALRKAMEALVPEIDPVLFIGEYEKSNEKYWELYEKGIISKEKLRIDRFLHPLNLFGKFNEGEASAVSEMYLSLMTEEKGLMPGTTETLEYLRGKGCRMSVVTNGFREVQYLKLKNSGIDGYFDSVIISDETGFHKPHPEIFRKAVDSINGKKDKSLMVGDNFANDIEGAMAFGMDQAFFNPEHLPYSGNPTYEIDDLRKLAEIVI